MKRITLRLDNIRKDFSRRTIFENISFSLTNGGSIAVTGVNGSGKSTLVKIAAGILTPTRGSVTIEVDGAEQKREAYHNRIGFVAPYLQLYDEFTAHENLRLFSRIRGIACDVDRIASLLNRVVLYDRRNDQVGTFSSGMKQRLKYAFALLHEPEILIFDEPRANLDRYGIAIVETIIGEHRGALLLATNDDEDLAHVKSVLNLDEVRTAAGTETAQ
jgi:heme exporter protein A